MSDVKELRAAFIHKKDILDTGRIVLISFLVILGYTGMSGMLTLLSNKLSNKDNFVYVQLLMILISVIGLYKLHSLGNLT